MEWDKKSKRLLLVLEPVKNKVSSVFRTIIVGFLSVCSLSKVTDSGERNETSHLCLNDKDSHSLLMWAWWDVSPK